MRGLCLCAAAVLSFGCKAGKIDLKVKDFIDDERSGAEIILGFSQIGSESAWRIRNTESVLDAAAKAGIQIIFDNARQNQENQIKAIRSFIVYRVDVIAFVPIVETGWDNVLQEAKDAMIPVIVVDRKISVKNPELYAGYIGEDALEEGRKAAKFLLEKFSGKERPLRILEISGTQNSSVARERAAGFREIIQTDPKFTIVRSVCGDFLKSMGRECMDNVLGTVPFDIVYSHNDAMTMGALESLGAHKIKAGADVVIVSVDGERQAVDALREGKINCIVECNPDSGPELMRLVKACANRNTIPRETYIAESVFTESDDFSRTYRRGF